MNDQTINRKLALAIGWKAEEMRPAAHDLFLMDRSLGPYFHVWEVFDYRDWRVIGPIAQRYDCFPERANRGDWAGYVMGTRLDTIYADTPQKAIALAVIAAHEAGVLK